MASPKMLLQRLWVHINKILIVVPVNIVDLKIHIKIIAENF
jgi:hypothetical protein